MHIRKNDVVLEIGSGNNPNPRSDILCDRYIHDNSQRAGEFSAVIDRPMVVADGYHLPFKNKSFDYVICSHILEHMEDPEAFLKEVTRVGRAGYIEVPSAMSERVFGWDFHLWYCEKDGNALILQKKQDGERFGGFFHRLIAQHIWFRKFFEEHEGAWYVRMEWREKIPIRVGKRPMSQDEIHELDEKAWRLLAKAKPEVIKDIVFAVQFLLRRIIRKTRKTMRMVAWRFGKRTDLTKRIICPQCHGHLLLRQGKMACGKCKKDYPIDGVIPILLSSCEAF